MVSLMVLGVAVGTWPQWAGSADHQALQLVRGAMGSAPVVKWGFQAKANFTGQFAAVGDVNGDIRPEVVVASLDSNVYCLSGSSGALLWSFKASKPFYSSPAVADVDGDGVPEVVAATAHFSFPDGDTVYCLSGPNGAVEWSFAPDTNLGLSPTVADLDGDGVMEVIAGSWWSGDAHVLDGATGAEKWSYIHPSNSVWISAPNPHAITAADLDGDGHLEVLVGPNSPQGLICLTDSGTTKWTFSEGETRTNAVVADVDGDGTQEVLVGSDTALFCLSGPTGTVEWYYKVGYSVRVQPSVGDVDGDGKLDIIFAADSIYCISSSGARLWADSIPNAPNGPGSLVDIDGDGKLEYLIGQKTSSGNTDTLYCLNAEDGSLLWKLGLAYGVHSPFPADVDADNCSEIVVTLQDTTPDGYNLLVLDDASDASGCGPLYMGSEEDDFSGLRLLTVPGGFLLLSSESLRIEAELFDVSGRRVWSWEGVVEGARTFKPRLKRGVYILRVEAGGKELKRSVIL